MLVKFKREYIKNKLLIAKKLKNILKLNILKSILQNKNILNYGRSLILIKIRLKLLNNKTKINDICLGTGVYRKSNRHINLARHELHKFCRTNKISTWTIKSW